MKTISPDDPEIFDPLRQIFGRKFYKVDARAAGQKTRSAVRHMIEQVQLGERFVLAQPTEKLIAETAHKTIVQIAKELKLSVKPQIITSNSLKQRNSHKGSVPEAIADYIGTAAGGQILLVAHEGLLRIRELPEAAKEWHLIVDEVFDPLLTGGVIKMRGSAHDIAARPQSNWTMGFIEARPLTKTLGTLGAEEAYYHIAPLLNMDGSRDPWSIVERHLYGQSNNQVYEIFKELPLWLLQKEPLFTHKGNWDNLMTPAGKKATGKTTLKKGHFAISGFRRPDRFLGFRSVTIMSALFDSTMLHNIWSKLGIEFVPSRNIKINEKTVPLGRRKVTIGYLTDAIWSKTSRDKSGGIEVIFDVIAASGLINRHKHVGVVVNKDDTAPARETRNQRAQRKLGPDTMIRKHFPKHTLLPHNVRGSNEWTDLDQLIYVAALNSSAPDIRWVEEALGIASMDQRIGRVGHEIYQAFTRLSVRDPTKTNDLMLIVPEKIIAEWLVPHFSPQEQVEIVGIDDQGRIHRPKPTGRPRSGKTIQELRREASRRYRLKKKEEKAKTRVV